MLRSGKRPLAVGFCAEAGARLAGALAHLHEQGLAHRDVKPSNVIFIKGQACLADIGLVAARDQRTFVGTEGFVPPEGPGSAGADVYALGKVLYEMATGKDRLDFPELPDEPIPKADNKRWLVLNKIICETCDPRIKKRRYLEAKDLESVLILIRDSRKVRKKSVPVGLAFTAFVVCATLLAGILLPEKRVVFRSAEHSLPEMPTVSFVTVTSIPEGAEVYDSNGILLGTTPFGPREYPIGMKVEYQLRYPGHQSGVLVEVLDQADEVFLVSVNRYPPEPGLEWRDILGQRYFPEPDGSHLSAYLVSPEEYLRVPQSGKSNWRRLNVSENGMRRRVAFVSQKQADQFVDWLAVESRADGIMSDEFRFTAELESRNSYQGVTDEVWDSGLRPFRVRVSPIEPGRLEFTTNQQEHLFIWMANSKVPRHLKE